MKINAIAHRGYPAKYNENTLQSYQAALDLSFTQLELDVHLSKDGIPVLMHDATLDRLTDGSGYIKDYTLKELKQFRIGEETIPTLEEALLLVRGQMAVNIDIKQTGNFYSGLEQAVLDAIHKTDMMDQVYLLSLDHFCLNNFRKLSKDVALGVSFIGSMPYIFDYMKQINAKYMSVKLPYITDEYYQMMEDNGCILVAWPIDTEEDMRLVRKRFPSALITTNHLELYKSIVENEL
ncbi:glycerophosphodiester phosphodiesterase [Paenibacillus piri]|uniref:Glycerophosphodiester phosphodiesterase n=1 Tax=Paenibacillus piri TaxID=2547395 RepID=A0A4R5KSX2_9BACL|nr:glycerophosphodiester phosphodiesterase family protein [Paenibacillus piri]TDF97970.1 glycerophosphodiester phosphodiesterase [Paenibacillus piri]